MAKKPATFTVRSIPFMRREPLRVIIPEYTHERGDKKTTFKYGDLFPWAELGMKPAAVERLYQRKVVRHCKEDNGRVIRSEAKKQKAQRPKQTDIEPAKEPDTETIVETDNVLDTLNVGDEFTIDTGAKFRVELNEAGEKVAVLVEGELPPEADESGEADGEAGDDNQPEEEQPAKEPKKQPVKKPANNKRGGRGRK